MNPFGESKDFDARMDTGEDPIDADFLFLGVATPHISQKPLETPVAEVKIPYYLGMEEKLINPYPQLAQIVAESETDPDEREAEIQQALESLDVESPEQFGIKYKGKLEEMAQEHGIGDLLGYSFRRRKIEVIGSDKILLVDYQMTPLHTRQIYGMEAPVEPEAEVTVEEESAGEPEADESEE